MASGMTLEVSKFEPEGFAEECQGPSGSAGTPVLISVRPSTDANAVRTPSDICCIIDVSWSMSMEAKVQAASGASESNGLAMLDIAKHAVSTVICTMSAQDRLCIIQFCRESRTVLDLTPMDEAGKEKAKEVLDKMEYGSGTDLWNGLSRGLEILHASRPEDVSRLCHTMLLTDGETENQESVLPGLLALKEKWGSLPGSVSSFGFGYEIDSKLLVAIANTCDGTYAFIPDAGFVGTIFVNAISTLLATFSVDAVLKVTGSVKPLGGWELIDGCIRLGTLQYGQTKDVVVVVDSGSEAEVCLEYTPVGSKSVTATAVQPAEDTAAEQRVQLCRSMFVDTLNALVVPAELGTEEGIESAKNMLVKLAEAVTESPAAEELQVKEGLLEDMLGQCCEAVSRLDYWQKWGRHYTPSVMFAHKLQQCNNFKDLGVQFYGRAELFSSLRDEADDAFNKLPAPKITPAQYRYLGGGKLVHNPDFRRTSMTEFRPSMSAVRAPAPAVDMSMYNDRCAG